MRTGDRVYSLPHRCTGRICAVVTHGFLSPQTRYAVDLDTGETVDITADEAVSASNVSMWRPRVADSFDYDRLPEPA